MRKEAQKMKYVNCGCGSKYVISDEWINLDFAKGKGVQKCNILKGLPFDEGSVDVIFSSCMLEHFTVEQAESHISDCYRVLKPNGIIRLVVPDLENVCKEYLRVLDLVRNDDTYESKYKYISIELIDQMTRMHSGGEMQKYWEASDKDEEYVLARTGYPEGWTNSELSMLSKVKMHFNFYKHIILSKFKIYNELSLGRFMLSGEVHRWMYDSYSLTKLLEKKGFRMVQLMKYNESEIVNWKKYKIEVTEQGNEYKPHCIYVEARK